MCLGSHPVHPGCDQEAHPRWTLVITGTPVLVLTAFMACRGSWMAQLTVGPAQARPWTSRQPWISSLQGEFRAADIRCRAGFWHCPSVYCRQSSFGSCSHGGSVPCLQVCHCGDVSGWRRAL